MLNKKFLTLSEAYGYVATLGQAGIPFEYSRVAADRFKKSKRRHYFNLLGVDQKTAKFCEKVAPGGTWNVEIEAPGTEFEQAGIFGMRMAKTQLHRASAWYSRYLPYAYGMMKAEWVFPYEGINYDSINGYYGTVCGFVYLGRGDDNIKPENGRPGWDRIDPADVALYNRIAESSWSIQPPSLPFEEAFGPALAYTAYFLPQATFDHCGDWWGWEHVLKVFEDIGHPRPKVRKKTPKKTA
jgi:hypothetical protein